MPLAAPVFYDNINLYRVLNETTLYIAPVPARPMKCPVPMLDANSDAPTGHHGIVCPARKYPFTLPLVGDLLA